MIRILALGLVIGLAACGGSSATTDDGPPDGAELFSSKVLGGQAGCVTCHSLEPDRVLVGPSLAGLGQRAGETVPGQSGREYIRTSIVAPGAHVVAGFDDGRMPSNWGEVLTESQVDALVDYLGGL
jgi:cytochrome c551/c552